MSLGTNLLAEITSWVLPVMIFEVFPGRQTGANGTWDESAAFVMLEKGSLVLLVDFAHLTTHVRRRQVSLLDTQ